MAGDIVVWILIGGGVLLLARRVRRALKGGSCACHGCGLAGPREETGGVKVQHGKALTFVSLDVLQGKHDDV